MRPWVIFSVSIAASLLIAVVGSAETACDNQAKPAFSCPPGYSVMCITTGTPHWGCGGTGRDGAIIETQPLASGASFDSGSASGSVSQQNETDIDFIRQRAPAAGGNSPSPPPNQTLAGSINVAVGGVPTFEHYEQTVFVPFAAFLDNPTSAAVDAVVLASVPAGSSSRILDRAAALKRSAIARLMEAGALVLPPEHNDAPGSKDVVLQGSHIKLALAGQVSKISVRGWDPQTREEIVGASAVEDWDDLILFLASEMSRDQATESIAFNFEKIVLKSQREGKLFWVIPITYREEITVLVGADKGPAAERVNVKYPWFHRFVREYVTRAELAAELAADLGKLLELQANAHTIAQTYSVISNIMKTKYDTAKNSISNVR